MHTMYILQVQSHINFSIYALARLFETERSIDFSESGKTLTSCHGSSCMVCLTYS